MNMSEPTHKQIRLIKQLGYTGLAPADKREASILIDQMREGASSSSAEKHLQRIIERDRKEWLRDVRKDNRESVKEWLKVDKSITGFEITIIPACKGARQYNGAILPLKLAKSSIELLPPYERYCDPETCECSFDPVFQDLGAIRGARLVVGPDEIISVRAVWWYMFRWWLVKSTGVLVILAGLLGLAVRGLERIIPEVILHNGALNILSDYSLWIVGSGLVVYLLALYKRRG